jgi:2,3-bisphosphoglycerate-independent phosphoglycerate mutase
MTYPVRMSGKKRRERTVVVGPEGSWRFQTGMVTAALLARGLSMSQAFDGSAQLREELRDREEITTDELEEAIEALAVAALGQASTRSGRKVGVRAGNSHFTADRLLRFAVSAGLTPQDALNLSAEVDAALARPDGHDLDEAHAEALVQRVLAERFGERAARRYALISSIRRARRPLVVLIGGATGTGKSTLATELAFRLGISHVTSTDMLREAMRAVLPRAVVPGLHDHSFQGMALGGQALSDPRERVLAGFRQQSDQVAVAVRAVIRRAFRESTPLVIEGTHLRPAFHRYVPADAEVTLAGLVLAVPSEGTHKRRFPERALRQPARGSIDYLESFQAVRWIQDDLLADADRHGALVVSNDDITESVDQVIEVLSRSVEFGPTVAPQVDPGPLSPRTLFLILDGMPDRPCAVLGGQTPLAAADAPTLRQLAAAGGQGLIQTGTGRGELPETDEGMMSLLAGPMAGAAHLGRGLLEAIGLGIDPPPDAVVLRGNLATRTPSGELIDRRAGRIRSGTKDLLADLLDVPLSNGLRGSLRAAHEHRVVVMLRGPGLSPAVGDTDPGSQALDQRVHRALALDDTPAAKRTAEALEELLDVAAEHLAGHPVNAARARLGQPVANCVITRGAASPGARPAPRLAPEHAAMVAGCSTALGVARVVGLQPITARGMTANLDTDVDAKLRAAASLLEERGLVVVHFKGTDIAAHDRRPLEKKAYIERVDAALGRMLRERPDVSEGLRIVVSSDHGTDSNTGDHLPEPVPLLIARWKAALGASSESTRFDEESAGSGALGLIQPGELQDLLWGG